MLLVLVRLRRRQVVESSALHAEEKNPLFEAKPRFRGGKRKRRLKIEYSRYC